MEDFSSSIEQPEKAGAEKRDSVLIWGIVFLVLS